MLDSESLELMDTTDNNCTIRLNLALSFIMNLDLVKQGKL
jgi:hypothetical protein